MQKLGVNLIGHSPQKGREKERKKERKKDGEMRTDKQTDKLRQTNRGHDSSSGSVFELVGLSHRTGFNGRDSEGFHGVMNFR